MRCELYYQGKHRNQTRHDRGELRVVGSSHSCPQELSYRHTPHTGQHLADPDPQAHEASNMVGVSDRRFPKPAHSAGPGWCLPLASA